jgi:DNA replication protein DnaC
LATRAEQDGLAYREYLAILMAEEVAHRAQTRIQRCVRRARFPFLKTIDEYDFTFQSAVRLSLLGTALSPEFVTAGHSLVFSGSSGTGKTHLAVAIAYRAIQNGFDAAFTTATALIAELSLASRRGNLRHALTAYTHPHVLVIDEVGYLSYGPDAANVLFQVVNDRYLHQRPMIFTTNKPLAAWGRVLHDPDLAEAILDRVLERGRHIELRGRSYRTRHAPLDLNPGSESPSLAAARISGNHPPEFPEPASPAWGRPSASSSMPTNGLSTTSAGTRASTSTIGPAPSASPTGTAAWCGTRRSNSSRTTGGSSRTSAAPTAPRRRARSNRG